MTVNGPKTARLPILTLMSKLNLQTPIFFSHQFIKFVRIVEEGILVIILKYYSPFNTNSRTSTKQTAVKFQTAVNWILTIYTISLKNNLSPDNTHDMTQRRNTIYQYRKLIIYYKKHIRYITRELGIPDTGKIHTRQSTDLKQHD